MQKNTKNNKNYLFHFPKAAGKPFNTHTKTTKKKKKKQNKTKQKKTIYLASLILPPILYDVGEINRNYTMLIYLPYVFVAI